MVDSTCASGSGQDAGLDIPGGGRHSQTARSLSRRGLIGSAAVAGLAAAVVDPAVASARQIADSRQAVGSFGPATGRILQEIIASGSGACNAPGLNVGIWVPGRGNYVQALGVSDLATDAPLQLDDHFRIASVTKTFTATAILQLVDENKISLDDRLARYVTGIPYGERITIAQLLGMTSGVYDFVGDPEFVAAYVANPLLPFSLSQVVAIIQRNKPLFPPGTSVAYDNSGYYLLGAIAEKVSSLPLGQLIAEKITQPGARMTAGGGGDVIWMRPERAATGRPARHSRDEITAAAIAIADREGLGAVSMRRVAAGLGTGAASLYRYLDTREDLLDLMIDATGAEYVFTPPTGDWLTDLLEIGEQARAIMRRHPWLPPLLTTRSVLGPNGLALLEHGLEALASHPASTAAKLEALALLNATTALFVQNELGGGPDQQQRNAAYLHHALAAGYHPRLAELLAASRSPSRTSLPEAATGPADPYPGILARILSGLLTPRPPSA